MSQTKIGSELRKRILDSIKMPRLRTERALLVTESYKETAGLPTVIRRARALLKYAEGVPIDIEDWQLIVGSPSADNFTLSPFPEATASWAAEMETFADRDGDKYFITDDDKASLREILAWWSGKTIEDHVKSRLPHDVKIASDAALIRSGYGETGSGNFAPDYRRVLSEGLKGSIDEIQKHIADLDLTKPEDFRRWHFYKAAEISCHAAIRYAERLSEMAGGLAETTTNPDRRADLKRIEAHLRQVPRLPARDFAEGLQCIWLLHCLLRFEASGGVGIVPGRMDQYLLPLYRSHVAVHGEEDARRWLANYWVNQNQLMYFLPKKTTAMIWSGHPVSEQPTIGGVTVDGRDASNELTRLFLEVERELGLPRPDVTVLYHPNIDSEVMVKAVQALPAAMKPKFFNYKVMRDHLVAKGATDAEALERGVVIGCVTAGVEGKTFGNNQMGLINLGKVLELALNNGVDPRTQRQIGPATGTPADLNSFDAVMDAFSRQLSHSVEMAVTLAIAIEEVHRELNPQPLSSLMTQDCLSRGLSVWEGGARYAIPGLVGVGLASVADSLAAVRCLVFEKKQVGMVDLMAAVRADWEGAEAVRSRCIHGAPKYGNDEDAVDELAARVAKLYCDKVVSFRGPRGVPYYPGLYSVSAHVALGMEVGATPDGRSAGSPLADGISPAQGVVEKGPTAVLRSMTKINQSQISTGTLQNMKISRSSLEKHAGKFIDLVRTYMEAGGYHIQFNIHDTATLKAAQANPEEYSGLVVRVAAYAAEFTSLPKAMQDDIIKRSELGLD